MARPSNEVGAALGCCRTAFVGIGLLSGLSNVLMLTGALFMLEIYDRVLPSRSIPTLIGLCAIALLMFVFLWLIDSIRARMMTRIGTIVDGVLTGRAYSAGLKLTMIGREGAPSPTRDLDAIRSFLQSGGPVAFFDLPWFPLYAGLCFLFHPWIGVAVLIGVVLLIIPTLITDYITKRSVARASEIGNLRSSLAESSNRNAEVLIASGMSKTMEARWTDLNSKLIGEGQRTQDVASGFGSLSKTMRMVLQSAVLALGAYLVIQQQATAGIIIASSILSARALQPIEAVIGHWKGFIAARQGGARLNKALHAFPVEPARTALPPPQKHFVVEQLGVAPPRAGRLIVAGVSFKLQAGQGLGIIGPSGSGKSTLVRALVGIWGSAQGSVRIDGAALDQWSDTERGRHIGYLPQDVELFSGTVAANIARFEHDPDEQAVVAAAIAAGCHDLILQMPQGYDTMIGENGSALSAGQRQRVALARALYKDPFVLVLDEPNSNLDHDGELALRGALMGVRERGGIVIVVAHRPSALDALDMVLVMAPGGRVKAFGPKETVLGNIVPMQRPAAPQVMGAQQ